jgi:hypothetical protein
LDVKPLAADDVVANVIAKPEVLGGASPHRAFRAYL